MVEYVCKRECYGYGNVNRLWRLGDVLVSDAQRDDLPHFVQIPPGISPRRALIDAGVIPEDAYLPKTKRIHVSSIQTETVGEGASEGQKSRIREMAMSEVNAGKYSLTGDPRESQEKPKRRGRPPKNPK